MRKGAGVAKHLKMSDGNGLIKTHALGYPITVRGGTLAGTPLLHQRNFLNLKYTWGYLATTMWSHNLEWLEKHSRSWKKSGLTESTHLRRLVA